MLPHGVAAAGQAGIEGRERHEQQRARRHRRQREAEPQLGDRIGAHGCGHGDGAGRRMKRATEDRSRNCGTDRNTDAKCRIGDQQTGGNTDQRGHRIAHDRGPWLRERAVRNGEQKDRTRAEGGDQVQSQLRVDGWRQNKEADDGKARQRAHTRAQGLGQRRGSDGRAKRPHRTSEVVKQNGYLKIFVCMKSGQ